MTTNELLEQGFGAVRSFHIPIAVAFSLCVCLADGAAKKSPSDQELLDGTWRVVEAGRNGAAATKQQLKKLPVVRIEHGTLSMPGEAKCKTELNARATPKQIDLIYVDGEDKGRRMKGIYELTEHTFRLCLYIGHDEATRPTDFSYDGPRSYLALKREK